MFRFEDLDEYIQEYFADIAKSLQEYGYQPYEAQSVVDKYKPILDRIGYDLLPEEWAEKLHQAHMDDVDVETWNRHCDLADDLEMQSLDSGNSDDFIAACAEEKKEANVTPKIFVSHSTMHKSHHYWNWLRLPNMGVNRPMIAKANPMQVIDFDKDYSLLILQITDNLQMGIKNDGYLLLILSKSGSGSQKGNWATYLDKESYFDMLHQMLSVRKRTDTCWSVGDGYDRRNLFDSFSIYHWGHHDVSMLREPFETLEMKYLESQKRNFGVDSKFVDLVDFDAEFSIGSLAGKRLE